MGVSHWQGPDSPGSPSCHSLAPAVTLSAVCMTVGTQTVGWMDGWMDAQPKAASTHREGGSLLRMALIQPLIAGKTLLVKGTAVVETGLQAGQ